MNRLSLGSAVLIGLVGSLLLGATTSAGVPIDTACEQAFVQKRSESETVNVGRHGYRVKPASVSREGDSTTVQGFFFHVIKGRNDRVHYTILVTKGQPYSATIDSIEYGGLFGANSKVRVAVSWTAKTGGGLIGARVNGPAGAAAGKTVGEKVGNLLLKGANAIQRKLIGKWEPTAPEILDGIANYFAKQP